MPPPVGGSCASPTDPVVGSWRTIPIEPSLVPNLSRSMWTFWTGSELVFIQTELSRPGFAFAPATNGWRTINYSGAIPSQRSGALRGYANGRFYVFGGKDQANAVLATGSSLDPATGEWLEIPAAGAPPLVGGQDGEHVVWAQGRLFFIVGAASNATDVAVATLDPQSGNWTTIAKQTLASTAAMFACTVAKPSGDYVACGDIIYSAALQLGPGGAVTRSRLGLSTLGGSIASGEDVVTIGTTAVVFARKGTSQDPIETQWFDLTVTDSPNVGKRSATRTLPYRSGPTVAALGARAMFWGGTNMGRHTDGWLFDPATDTWSSMACDGAPQGGVDAAGSSGAELFVLSTEPDGARAFSAFKP